MSIPLKLEYRKLELDEIFSNSHPAAVILEAYHLKMIQAYLKDLTVIIREGGSLHVEQKGTKRIKLAEVADDIVSLNYTYRGYGYPIAAIVPHEQYLHGVQELQNGLQAEAGQSMLYCLPMSHIFTLVGCILVPLLNKLTGVISCTLLPRHLFRSIQEWHIENITAVPEIFSFLGRLKDTSSSLRSLKAFVSGGSILDRQQYEKLKEAFTVDVLHGYGLTEFAPVCRNIRGQARAGTIGPLCRCLDARIDQSDPGGVGEIVIRSPYLFRGYYRREREFRETFHDGWFHTGDLGNFDGDHLVFVREIKKTCKVNAAIVDLEEVRRALCIDSEVEQAEVFRDGDRLAARIALRSRPLKVEKALSLKTALKDIVAHYKIPKEIVGLPEGS